MPAPTTANATRAEETATIAEKKRIKFKMYKTTGRIYLVDTK